MKTLVSVIVGIVIAWLVFFKFDPWLVKTIIEMLEVGSSDSIGLIKVILWIAVICCTGAFTFVMAALAGILTRVVLGD